MRAIQLDKRDIELLYSFPKPPTNLSHIIRCFTFINRTPPPSYEELTTCLSKAQRAGIIRVQGQEFFVNENWFARIHAADKTAANEIESMLEFEAQYLNTDIEVVAEVVVVPTVLEYESMLAKLS